MTVTLDNLPKTIDLVRLRDDDASPEGAPVLVILDQTKLPAEVGFLHITDWREVIDAIKALKVRGAPAIGITGAAIMALRAAEYLQANADAPQDELDFDRVFVIDADAIDPELYRIGMDYAAGMVKRARPTAVSLAHAVDASMAIVEEELETGQAPSVIAERLFELACSMAVEDEERNRLIGAAGANLLEEGSVVLTHCNAGSLATGFYGTALGVVYTAFAEGKVERVYADETRPVLQGTRLTAWELCRAGVPVTLICDDMAASVMATGEVDAVIVGADRIAANGDVANKIGTLGVAVLAHHFGIPFFVAAPVDTIDPHTVSGADIVIEQRDASEVIAEPIDGVDVLNPAFDVTPAALVTAIITERGVFVPALITDALDMVADG